MLHIFEDIIKLEIFSYRAQKKRPTMTRLGDMKNRRQVSSLSIFLVITLRILKIKNAKSNNNSAPELCLSEL